MHVRIDTRVIARVSQSLRGHWLKYKRLDKQSSCSRNALTVFIVVAAVVIIVDSLFLNKN